MIASHNVPILVEKVSEKSPNGAISAFSKLSGLASSTRLCYVTKNWKWRDIYVKGAVSRYF